jgi:hypothetical protein
MNRIAIAALAAITLLVSGCSWAFSRPPQRTHRAHHANGYGVTAPPLCGPRYVAPVIDLWQAVGGGIVTLYALGQASDSDADTVLLVAAITGGVSALFGASAHYGFKQARACRELRTELASGGAPPPVWIAPSVRAEPGVPAEQGITIEQDIDVDEDQIEVRTRIRPGPPPPAPR